jgi:DNA-directed RNA polymerase subunit RPC12/RpoP
LLPTHDVDCPSCGQRVYTALSLEDVIPAEAPTAPRVLHDAQGDYLVCPSCKTRIAMQRVSTKGGVGFRVSTKP